MSNSTKVQAWRHRLKRRLIAVCGGSCRICDYSKCKNALEFHHLDPNEKEFAIGTSGITRSLERSLNEIKKCILVCSNCHREIHAGMHDESFLIERNTFLVDVASQVQRESAELRKATQFTTGNQRVKLVAATIDLIPDEWRVLNGIKLKHGRLDWSTIDILDLIAKFDRVELARLLGVTRGSIQRRLNIIRAELKVADE